MITITYDRKLRRFRRNGRFVSHSQGMQEVSGYLMELCGQHGLPVRARDVLRDKGLPVRRPETASSRRAKRNAQKFGLVKE